MDLKQKHTKGAKLPFYLEHLFDLIDDQRRSAVHWARATGDVYRFRWTFGKQPFKEATEGMGLPFNGYNRQTIKPEQYEEYKSFLDQVSKEDAIEFFGVTSEEYDLWMAPWTTYRLSVQRDFSTPYFVEMEFESEEIAKLQIGEYPEDDLKDDHRYWWKHSVEKRIYESIDDGSEDSWKVISVEAIS